MTQPHRDLEEMTIAEMTAGMEAGAMTSQLLVRKYLDRIHSMDQALDLRSIIEVNPRAEAIATMLDVARAADKVRGPLHGIPILLKDNIDTTKGMATTAGSLALADSRPGADATVTSQLEAAGAVILGKTNLSEWANFRSTNSSSGWSAVGGACRNPYVLDRNPCGSSSGSGAAVSANFAAAALGTETDGSIACPSTVNGVVGLKPTVGLTSRAGVVPISRTQDTVGPMARTVADAAAVLGALTGVDERDPATAESVGRNHIDYTQFLDPEGLAGSRIGVARQLFIGENSESNAVMERVVGKLTDFGVELVDPVEFPSFEEFSTASPELDVMLLEFKTDIAGYLETRVGGPKTLAELIEFNRDNADAELQWFGQEIFEAAQARGGVVDPGYAPALAASRRISRDEGLDVVLDGHNLDAIIAPTGAPAWPTDLVNGDHFLGGSASYAAMAGYPLLTVPMGSAFGLPVGISFIGRAWSEPTLIRLASGFEAKLGARRPPQFLPTLQRH
ncbi:MAG: amidase [Acidimicrobiia bacterium]|nr:amidase [Acidimicrobiia bacterium]